VTMDIETFDSLWAYCTANARLVPMPAKWAALHGMLANTRQKPSGGWEPPLPLILAAWDCTMPIEKQLRFREHIRWASNYRRIKISFQREVELKNPSPVDSSVIFDKT
jgi:hypothetical protein